MVVWEGAILCSHLFVGYLFVEMTRDCKRSISLPSLSTPRSAERVPVRCKDDCGWTEAVGHGRRERLGKRGGLLGQAGTPKCGNASPTRVRGRALAGASQAGRVWGVYRIYCARPSLRARHMTDRA